MFYSSHHRNLTAVEITGTEDCHDVHVLYRWIQTFDLDYPICDEQDLCVCVYTGCDPEDSRHCNTVNCMYIVLVSWQLFSKATFYTEGTRT